jgi:hypothetical protein
MAAVSFDRISGATVTPSEVWSFDREQCDKTLTLSRRWVQAGQISPSWFLLVGSSRGNRVMCLMHKRINSVGNYSEATAIGRSAGDSGEIRVQVPQYLQTARRISSILPTSSLLSARS